MAQLIRFSYVSREIRSIVARRREILIFLASLFAAVGIYLQNLSLETLPDGLAMLREQALLTYALVVGIPSFLLALRIARLHGGMVINGLFYRALLRKSLTHRLNLAGISTQMFVLSAIITAWAVWLFISGLGVNSWFSALIGLLAFLLLIGIFYRTDVESARFALTNLEQASLDHFENEEEIIEHQALSLQDANQDMLALLTFSGLMLFAVLQTFSGFGEAKILPPHFAQETLAFSYLVLGLLVIFLCIIMYLRLVLSVGQFALALNPADKPFSPWRLSDSFLGYLLLGFFAVIPAHLLLYSWLNATTWGVSALLLLIIWLIYPLWQSLAARLTLPVATAEALAAAPPADLPPPPSAA
jgi:hypothetical protein